MPKKKFTASQKSTLSTTKTSSLTKKKAILARTQQSVKVDAPAEAVTKNLFNKKGHRRRVFGATWRDYRRNWWQLTRISGPVMLLISLLLAYQSHAALTADQTQTGISYIGDLTLLPYAAGIFVLLALIWTAGNTSTTGKLKVSEIYNASSGRYLPFLTIALLQSILVIPLIFGAFITLIAVSSALTIWLVVLGTVLILIALILMLWYSQSLYVVLAEKVTSFRAMAMSRRLVIGRMGTLLFDYFLFGIMMLLIIVAVSESVGHIKSLNDNWLVQGTVSAVLLTLLLSVGSVFGYNIYQDVTGNNSKTSRQAR